MIVVATSAAGFLLDLVIGDPPKIPHPIVAIGKAISALESFLRRVFPDTQKGLRWAGRVMATLMPIVVFVITWGIIAFLWWIHPIAGIIAACWLSCQILSTCELKRQSTKVARSLADGGIEAGRYAVSMIVGRDTKNLDEAGVIKATVETIAENTSDGVVAPLFYMMIGGAPLAMAYKAINTMDSMVGYKNDRYIDFGRAAAHLDDVANYLPARICATLMVAVSPLVKLNASRAFAIWKRDRRNHASPNSAQTESVIAGALGVELAGDATYFGKKITKPTIGDAIRPIERDDIKKANHLMIATSVIACILFGLIRIGIVCAIYVALVA